MARKIIIIGAGIIGASIAYHLAKAGGDVSVIEKSLPASGATSKSFAWINASFPENLDFYRLRTASIKEYHVLEKELGGTQFKVRWGGSLSWDLGNEELHQAEKFDYPLSRIDQQEFAALEPAVMPAPDDSILAQMEGAINPVAATNALLEAAADHGAKLSYGLEVESFIISGNRVTGVKTAIGSIIGDHIVVAAGVWAQSLLAALNIDLPMNNSYGLLARTKPVARVLSHVILSPDLHFHQELDGSIVVGESFSGSELSDHPFDDAGRILHTLKRRLPDVKGLKLDFITFGNRPIPEDGFPVVGPVCGVDGLYLATMHSGITLAPIIGRLASEEILSNTPSDLLKPYRLSRFQ